MMLENRKVQQRTDNKAMFVNIPRHFIKFLGWESGQDIIISLDMNRHQLIIKRTKK